MNSPTWLACNWKEIVIHTLILTGFVLFCVFVAEPFFAKLEANEGEATLQNLSLPPATDNIKYSVGELTTDGSSVITVKGWAFIEGKDTRDSSVYLVLKSKSRTYVFDSVAAIRQDVTKAYKNLNLNLDYSGYLAMLPARKLDNGQYTLGIYIKKGEIQALHYTPRIVLKSNNQITLPKGN